MSARAVAWTLAALGVVASAGALALVQTSSQPHRSLGVLLFLVAIGLVWTEAGAVAYARRPDNRTGLLMAAVGFAWLTGALENVDSPILFTASAVLSALWIALLIHLVLVFPAGRARDRGERALVAGVYVIAIVLSPLRVLVAPSSDLADCGDVCPSNMFLVDDRPALADLIDGVTIALWVAVAVAVLVLLVRRWRRAGGPARRALAPVLACAAAAIVLLLVAIPVDAVSNAAGTVVELAALVAVAGIPVGFLVGLLRTRLARGSVDRLVVELSDVAVTGGVRAALARSLRDPSLELAYWLPDERAYVDAGGQRVDEGSVDGRAVTTIAHRGEPVALVTHDPTLNDEPGLVAAACAAAGMALANERLQAELRRRLVELRLSRARLLAAADGERRRLERDLHDGAQQRLVALAIVLRRAETAAEKGDPPTALIARARAELDQAMAGLRELARGIHPAVLTDHGLGPALRTLVDRAALPVELDIAIEARPPPQVEVAAFYVVAESLTNVAKHAGASRAWVSVAESAGRLLVRVRDDGRGGARPAPDSGLRGLVDRVEAVGGRLSVESPSGEGTAISADLPLDPEARAA